MKYYKFLHQNHGPYSKFDFTPYLPVNGAPGPWLPKEEWIEPCRSGYHACELGQIVGWMTDGEMYEVELAGETLSLEDKVVAQEMRFIRRIETYTDGTRRADIEFYDSLDELRVKAVNPYQFSELQKVAADLRLYKILGLGLPVE